MASLALRIATTTKTGRRVSGFLAKVCAEARERVSQAAAQHPLDDLLAQAEKLPVPPSFATALLDSGVSVIAEVKRASPSRGDLAPIPDAGALAQAYADGGAAAISVLTEPKHFLGSLDDLQTVAARVAAPALRKDFIVDPYQVWEARAAGAAACLLIVVALEQEELVALLQAVDAAGMVALLEAHDELEVTRAIGGYEAAGITGRPVLGINARDLTTLDVDTERFSALRATIPDGAVAVAESGVRDADDVRRLGALGADAVLVGESVATAQDPTAAVAALVAAGRTGAAA